MRDDFTIRTKEILARRAGMCCSNPKCQKPTFGPQDEQQSAVNIGVACHITAASPGGKRYSKSMSSEKRKSIENAIWLCQNCAKLIDTDEVRFSVKVLNHWKQIAEKNARHAIEEGFSSSTTLQTIKVLIVTAEHPKGPKNFYKTNAFKNINIIRNALLPSDNIDVLQDACLFLLSQALMEGYDIIQFEAGVDADGTLVLGDEKISPTSLANTIGNRNVSCALFMTCNSANVIGALHATNIPCVIAATGYLYVDYSKEFCRVFYSSLSKGFSLSNAFNHANVVSSHALVPYRDLRCTGDLCISGNITLLDKITFRKPNKNP